MINKKNNINVKQQFDIIVIGAGSGGLNIAAFINRIGLRVLLVDKSDAHIGGDCLNFGCIPSKALIHVARTVQASRDAEMFGCSTSGKADWKKVREYIKEKQAIIRAHENAAWFREKGMTVILGEAEFASPQSILVQGVEYWGKKIVIATGSHPRHIEGRGIERVSRVLNNENIFNMEELPSRLLVIGGGPIGMEIAQALSSLGSKVTVSERSGAILGKEDPEISGVLLKEMEKQGIRFLMKSVLKEFISPTEALFTLDSGEVVSVSFDAVFVGIGRVLNAYGLKPEKANMMLNERGGFVVDEYLRTTNKNIFLCGDIAGGFQFTHTAEMHAAVILRNLFSPFKKKYSPDNISWTTYTTPEVASFGIWEEELKKRGMAYKVLSTSFGEDDRAITDGYQYGKIKLFISLKGKILGGTMVAPHAGELISELVLANSSNLHLNNLFNKTYAYPTATRINKRVISSYVAEKLTQRAKTVLRSLYRVIS